MAPQLLRLCCIGGGLLRNHAASIQAGAFLDNTESSERQSMQIRPLEGALLGTEIPLSWEARDLGNGPKRETSEKWSGGATGLLGPVSKKPLALVRKGVAPVQKRVWLVLLTAFGDFSQVRGPPNPCEHDSLHRALFWGGRECSEKLPEILLRAYIAYRERGPRMRPHSGSALAARNLNCSHCCPLMCLLCSY